MERIKSRTEKKEFLRKQIEDIKRRQENLEFQKRNLENKLFNLERMGDEVNETN